MAGSKTSCVLLILGATVSGPSSILPVTDWPEVAPFKRTFDFPDARKASVTLMIRNARGDRLYKLDCHNFLYHGDPDFDYSGDFECRLSPIYTTTSYSTLFTDTRNQTRDWESRARFLVRELTGRCAEYPEYGRIRTFRLRGMKITLTLSDVEIKGPIESSRDASFPLRSFRFSVGVSLDPLATSEIAEAVKAAWPPAECGTGYRSDRVSR